MSRGKVSEATLLLGAGNLAVNALQLLKLIIVSAYFGATSGRLDEYNLALTLALTIQGIMTGSLQASFIPVYVRHRSAGEDSAADSVLRSIFSLSAAVFTVSMLLLALFAVPLVQAVSGTRSVDALQLNVNLFRISLVMVLLNGISDVLTAFYNGNHRYLVPATAPLLAILVSTAWIVLFPEQGVYALANGLVAGSLVQCAMLLAGVRRFGGFSMGFSFRFWTEELRPIYRMVTPVALSLLIAHCNLLIDQAVANRFGAGTVTVLGYASRLHDVMAKVFVYSLSAALLPYLSTYVAERKFLELRSTVSHASRLAFLVLVPVGVLIYLFARPALAALLQRGEFTAKDSSIVGYTWAAYSAGLFFTGASIFAVRALNALQDRKIFYMAGALGLPLNLVLDIVFARFWGAVGIALGTTVTYAILNILCFARLRIVLRRNIGVETPAGSTSALWKMAGAVGTFVAVAVTSFLALRPFLAFGGSLSASDRIRLLAIPGVLTILSFAIYFAILRVLDIRETRQLFDFLAGRLSVLRLPRRRSPTEASRPTGLE